MLEVNFYDEVDDIRTCKKVFTKQQNIWNCFLEICF